MSPESRRATPFAGDTRGSGSDSGRHAGGLGGAGSEKPPVPCMYGLACLSATGDPASERLRSGILSLRLCAFLHAANKHGR